MIPTTEDFQTLVWQHYADHSRDLPWRQPQADGNFDPYRIMVSEIMLQQTQVNRVIEKYQEFLARFPDIATLAAAPLADVLALWSGLGYNRRAKFLHDAAKQIVLLSAFPREPAALTALPGIGPNTAGAILAYAYDAPVAYIETNIRSVFIYHFFPDEAAVSDKAIMQLVAETLPADSPRQWYWALMDYGSYLKRTQGNHARSSKTYTKQSVFAGSRRQLRGEVLRQLIDAPKTAEQLQAAAPDDRLSDVIRQLCDEQLIVFDEGQYRLGT